MDTLKTKKYKYVKNMLSLDIVDFLSTWSLRNFLVKPDNMVLECFSIHSEESEIYRHVLHYLKPIMEIETGLSLKPIYSYNRVYMGGAELKKHTDREECEISASITLKHFYNNKDYKWPLYMGDLPLVINEGDGVIYRGHAIEHWRPVFKQPKQCWHHQLFVHYVNLNGPFKNIEEELKFKG